MQNLLEIQALEGMKNLTKFEISDTKYFKINPECIHKDECEVCANIDIDYIDKANNICIRFGYTALSDFCYFIAESGGIQKLINGELRIDGSITDDLGFENNQYFKGITKKSVVFNYYFSSNDHKEERPYYNGWLYNDTDGNVIFEITPFYPFFYETRKTHPDFITYKQFIKNYKPTLKIIIRKENLTKWIIQAKKLKKKYFPELIKE
ncbi:hypothetical protein KAZ82_01665 [Candidatus Babeliales bacterium]|nr:hypothetical protein [Candidatus Babeliales bacterium]